MALATEQRNVHSDVSQNSILDVLAPAIRAFLKEVGEAETKAIEAHLSVPVERGAGGYVIKRSDPGEAPRKEEDILRQNIEYHITQYAGQLPCMTITANRPPQEPDDDMDAAVILEFGGQSNWGEVLPRPFMTPAMNRIKGYAEEVLAKNLRQALPAR